MPDEAQFERIYRLWDELADFGTTHADTAMECLLRVLCALVDAQNASWVGAVRMGEPQPGDPVKGWRPRSNRRLHPDPAHVVEFNKHARQLEEGLADLSTIRNVTLAGRFRTRLLKELVPASWFQGDVYRTMYLDLGYHDAIWAGIPVNEDAECYFGLFRSKGESAFTTAERDIVAFALRGLRWFMRQQMLAHGLLVASSPLTPVERKVLHGLLSGLSEKQIAAAQCQPFNTTHTHIKRLFRKYNVRNRAALMALWLGDISPN